MTAFRLTLHRSPLLGEFKHECDCQKHDTIESTRHPFRRRGSTPEQSTMKQLLLIVAIAVISAHAFDDCVATAQFKERVRNTEKLVPRFYLGLIHAPEVHAEIGLSPNQTKKLERLFAIIDGRWLRARNQPQAAQLEQLLQLESEARQWFESNTEPKQRDRLRQLELQAQDIRILLRPDINKALSMTTEQADRMAALARSTEDAKQQLQSAVRKNEPTESLKQAVADAIRVEKDGLQTVLKTEQLRAIDQILGAPFNTNQLQRIYPMAPELVPVRHWINSEPLTLKSQRGKVVLLHFYAFQCHNCHANFEHYRKWHEQFGDDVVVIGIQTPETSLEQKPDAVRAAAQKRGLKFPILVDLDSENWKTWSNTMWPTVYVIDRDGYIRQWWQGELNWKGATGDQTIESLVRKLIQ